MQSYKELKYIPYSKIIKIQQGAVGHCAKNCLEKKFRGNPLGNTVDFLWFNA
jgi:hypothetical protein